MTEKLPSSLEAAVAAREALRAAQPKTQCCVAFLGDVVEAESMGSVFSEYGLPPKSVPLGSVKSNIGHLKGAAGAASLLKTALALHHKVLPPTLKADPPDPEIGLADSPFYLNTASRPWFRRGGQPRRAGVSAFGFGGNNAHLLVEEHREGEEVEGPVGREAQDRGVVRQGRREGDGADTILIVEGRQQQTAVDDGGDPAALLQVVGAAVLEVLGQRERARRSGTRCSPAHRWPGCPRPRPTTARTAFSSKVATRAWPACAWRWFETARCSPSRCSPWSRCTGTLRSRPKKS